MPCYDPQAAEDRAQAAKDSERVHKEHAELVKRVAFLEAALCGTRKALISVNEQHNQPSFGGLNYEEMGISQVDYISDHIEHSTRDQTRKQKSVG
ncbi:MAG: hypothetical protein RR877_00895 [Aurantimicrobium sp.]|uniref:hypothetical protein n=1 Tax=Aurantimicrobium sp. TaxID=1930784 RepID=UPI002FC60F01